MKTDHSIVTPLGKYTPSKYRIRTAKKTSAKKQQVKRKPTPKFDSYKTYLRSKHWILKRKEALAFHGPVCNECGSVESLQVHHLTYKRIGREKMSDLQVLCKRCHSAKHEGDNVLAESTLDFFIRFSV